MNEMMKENDIIHAAVAFSIVQFAVLFFMFHASGIGKVFTVFLVLVFVFELPGSILVSYVRKKTDMLAILLALPVGLMSVTLVAYLFGVFGIAFTYSLAISVGVPYVYLFMQPNVREMLKNIAKKFKVD